MSLESLLDDARISGGSGRVQIDSYGDEWRAVIAHHKGAAHQVIEYGSTPSQALRLALMADRRILADDIRRYKVSPKLGQYDLEDYLALDIDSVLG